MHTDEWLVTPFDMKIDNKCNVFDQKDEHIEMHDYHEANALFKSKNLSEY